MIDTHCHFDMMPEPERYIKEAEERGDIIIGMTNLPSHFRMGIGHVQGFKHIRLALGMHPQLVSQDTISEMTLFRELVDKTSYIGEIGLDFSRAYHPNRYMQINCLRQILAILKGKNKIISVHSRRAEKELLELLTEYETRNVIFHWYSGPLTLIDQILEKGYYFSINEAMCLSKNGSKIIQAVPKDRILLESDAPFNDRCSLKSVRARVGLEEKQLIANFKQLISRLRIPEQ